MSATDGRPRLWQRSVEVIHQAQHPSGGYVAAPTYPTYRYVWVRDGSFIAEAMRVAGERPSADRFHRFVAQRVLHLTPDGEGTPRLLPARFEPDGGLDRSDWPNFQLDGYGLWLWSLERFASGDPLDPLLGRAAEAVGRYLAARWRDPCHDPWEEGGDRRPTATLLAILSGLEALQRLLGPGPWTPVLALAWEDLERWGVAEGHLTKDLGDPEGVDAATLWAVAPLELLDPRHPLAAATVAAVEARLGAPAVHRHPRDSYYGGGGWPVLAAFWGESQWLLGRPGEAWRALRWIEGTATPEGHIPEQVPEGLLVPEGLTRWQAERGPVATPLVWSHAMYLLLAARLDPEVPAPAAGTV